MGNMRGPNKNLDQKLDSYFVKLDTSEIDGMAEEFLDSLDDMGL